MCFFNKSGFIERDEENENNFYVDAKAVEDYFKDTEVGMAFEEDDEGHAADVCFHEANQGDEGDLGMMLEFILGRGPRVEVEEEDPAPPAGGEGTYIHVNICIMGVICLIQGESL